MARIKMDDEWIPIGMKMQQYNTTGIISVNNTVDLIKDEISEIRQELEQIKAKQKKSRKIIIKVR